MAYWSQAAKVRSRNRRKRNYIALYQKISDKYQLNLKYESIEREAHHRAQAEVDAQGFAWDVFTNPMAIITLVVAIILTVVTIFVPGVAPATWKSWEGFGAALSIAAAWGSVGLVYWDTVVGAPERNYIQEQVNLMGNVTQSFKQNAQEALQQRDLLTYFLVFAPYEICATGKIFSAQAPSADRASTFSPSQAYDTNKGFLGTYKKDKVDEMIMNRAHINLAGNVAYNGTGVSDFPLAKFDDNLSNRLNGYEDALKGAVERLAKGFQELADEQYGIWNNGEGAKQDYKDCYNEQCESYKKLMINDSFLDMMKSYNRGIRYDWLQLITHRTFAEKTRTQDEAKAAVKQSREALVKKFTDKEGDIDEKAKIYYETINAIMEYFYDYYLAGELFSKQTFHRGIYYTGKEDLNANAAANNLPLIEIGYFGAGAQAENVEVGKIFVSKVADPDYGSREHYNFEKINYQSKFSYGALDFSDGFVPQPSTAIEWWNNLQANLASKSPYKINGVAQPAFVVASDGWINNQYQEIIYTMALSKEIYDFLKLSVNLAYTDEETGERVIFNGDFSILDNYDWSKIDEEYSALS